MNFQILRRSNSHPANIHPTSNPTNEFMCLGGSGWHQTDGSASAGLMTNSHLNLQLGMFCKYRACECEFPLIVWGLFGEHIPHMHICIEFM